MSGPFIFIATNRLRPGQLDSERKRLADLSAFIQANEPRLLAFNEYINEERSEVAVVQIHPDLESMLFHMEVVRERATQAYAETLDSTTSIEIFGPVSEEILTKLRQAVGESVPITVMPDHLGGFIRVGTSGTSG